MECPCGSGNAFSACCEPLIKNEVKATSAEQLIRSRYSAFTVCEMEYVLNTHHPKTRSDVDMEANLKWAKSSSWLGLEIHEVEDDNDASKKAFIKFTAKFKTNGKTASHKERSEFRKEGGEWFFYDGESLDQETFVRQGPKVGRNDPCECGSGKKSKKCCGAN